MQGNPRCLATWTMKPQMGKKCVWHSHLRGILALVPSAEAFPHLQVAAPCCGDSYVRPHGLPSYDLSL